MSPSAPARRLGGGDGTTSSSASPITARRAGTSPSTTVRIPPGVSARWTGSRMRTHASCRAAGGDHAAGLEAEAEALAVFALERVEPAELLHALEPVGHRV